MSASGLEPEGDEPLLESVLTKNIGGYQTASPMCKLKLPEMNVLYFQCFPDSNTNLRQTLEFYFQVSLSSIVLMRYFVLVHRNGTLRVTFTEQIKLVNA